MEGKTLGNHRILRKVGEGGMGSVYLARDLTLEREVAIKIISPVLARNPHLMARFRVEAIAQARLNHTNIVTIHSFDHQEEIYYIVMEYVPGKTLKNLVKETGKLPIKQALAIASHILDGLAYAHAREVLHRDIKPANVFITPGETAKLGDFGIAKVKGIDGLTRVGSTLGTLLYSSPEQIRGEKMNAATDIYSLGVTLYEMMVGTPPFTSTSGSDYDIQVGHLEKIPPAPSSLVPGVPPVLDAVIMKALAKLPAQRYRSAGEFKNALDFLRDDADKPKKTTGKGRVIGRKISAARGLKIPKIKFPKIKPAAIKPAAAGTPLKKFAAGIPAQPNLASSFGIKGMDRRRLLIILIVLICLLFFIVIAFAQPSPAPARGHAAERNGIGCVGCPGFADKFLLAAKTREGTRKILFDFSPNTQHQTRNTPQFTALDGELWLRGELDNSLHKMLLSLILSGKVPGLTLPV